MKLIQQIFFLIVLFGSIVACRARTYYPVIKINTKKLTFGFQKKGRFVVGNQNQTQFYSNLSTQFDFRLTVFNNDANPEPSGTVLKIYSKNGEFVQKFEIENSLMFPLNLKEVTSFEKTVRYNSFGQDNIFGTLVVEDFNFDSLYDIAIMHGCAVNGNAFYNYYIQQSDSTFRLDKYLTRKVSTYPEKRDVQKKRLTNVGISFNSCTERTFEYNQNLKSWKKIKEVVHEQY